MTGAGSDYRIDSTLYHACEPVVQTVCKDIKYKADAMYVIKLTVTCTLYIS